MSLKRIILCADDYGQNQAISEGILDLVELERLNAVSCMVNGSCWSAYAQRIASYSSLAIGLHLNFTYGTALSQPRQNTSLLALINQSYFPSKDFKTAVHEEIKAQILRFKQDVGRWPEFIDGHQHVHQLPVIRQSLVAIVQELNFKPWFRTTASFKTLHYSDLFSWKKWALLVLGGQTWQRLLDKHHLSYPSDFSGEYSFHQAAHYRHIFLNAAKKLRSGGLMMCHPGLESQDVVDQIAASRYLEYQYFKSPQFISDINQLNIQLF